VILTATSGDTGSAVAHAFHNVDRISMVVLFPIKEVSDRQRKQDDDSRRQRYRSSASDGQFDDCQALVKRAFVDPELSASASPRPTPSTSAGFCRSPSTTCTRGPSCKEDNEAAVISVPSGNFGRHLRRPDCAQDGLSGRAVRHRDQTPTTSSRSSSQRAGTTRSCPSRVCISNAMTSAPPLDLPRLVARTGA